MTRKSKAPLWIKIVGLLGAIFGAMLLFAWAASTGNSLQARGIKCCEDNSYQTFVWSTRRRQPFPQYIKQQGISPNSFTGSLALCRPGSEDDEYEVSISKGKLALTFVANQPTSDKQIAEDFKHLRSGGLAEMLVHTKNDWRIYNDSGHFIDPTGPFTGTVDLYPNMLGWFETMEVVNDKIVSSHRHFGFNDD